MWIVKLALSRPYTFVVLALVFLLIRHRVHFRAVPDHEMRFQDGLSKFVYVGVQK